LVGSEERLVGVAQPDSVHAREVLGLSVPMVYGLGFRVFGSLQTHHTHTHTHTHNTSTHKYPTHTLTPDHKAENRGGLR
jgi:hypothetical protein